jgi:ectoine hydroxylase-related dioxygenase (phytanoyl-CoA dioxygenase family)
MSTLDAARQFSAAELKEMTEEFFREGCVVVREVLTPEEVDAIRTKTDAYATQLDAGSKHMSFVGETLVLRRCHELDPVFDAMRTHEPIVRVVEAALGVDARFNAMNVIRNQKGQAISNWHVDDVLEFPLPAEIPRFDGRMRMPVFWLTVQIALSDIDDVENGPTQFVPGSHYSGRRPNSQENPEFEGQGPRAVLCKAGDIYLTNHQCWHRGAPNLSDRTRYIMQVQYAQRWADARFRGLA